MSLHSSSGRARRRLLLAPVVALTMLGVAIDAQAAKKPGKQSGGRDSRFDTRIQEVVNGKSNEGAPVAVIITVKPDARNGLIKRLLAQGATVRVGTQFSIIESFSATLPKRVVRQLEKDKDVVSESRPTDSPRPSRAHQA
jgi:hypothetical protein